LEDRLGLKFNLGIKDIANSPQMANMMGKDPRFGAPPDSMRPDWDTANAEEMGKDDEPIMYASQSTNQR